MTDQPIEPPPSIDQPGPSPLIPEPWTARQCKAKSSRTGNQCGKWAMHGQDVCRSHGGATQAAKAKAQRRLESERAVAAVARFGLSLDVSPSDALLEEVRWTAGHVAWLREKVGELSDQQIVYGLTKAEADGSNTILSRVLEARVSVWYELYLKERAHLVRVCAEAIRAGVEERRVQLAEQQGHMVAGVLRRILDGMFAALVERGVPVGDVWEGLVVDIVPRELRTLTA